MDETKYNASHKYDPTSHEAIRAADRQPQHISEAVALIKGFLEILNLELVGRIEIRDKKTGRKWK